MPNYNLKENIIKTFDKLLRTHSIDEIDVQLICDTLKIKRQSFYYHFNNVYELVSVIYEYEPIEVKPDLQIDGIIKEGVSILYKNLERNLEIANSSCEDIIKDYLFAYFYMSFAGFFEKMQLKVDAKNEASRIISNSILDELLYLFKLNSYSENDLFEKLNMVFNEKYLEYFISIYKGSNSNWAKMFYSNCHLY